MKNSRLKLKSYLVSGFLAVAILSTVPLVAAEAEEPSEKPLTEAQRAQREAQRAQREAMLQAIEISHQEIERVAEQARLKAEILRQDTERLRAESAEMAHESEQVRQAQRRELARTREELSRTHRELRRASQEVARAHRDLTLVDDRRIRAQMINLGDRAIMGVILGGQTEDGIKIMGLSPDGPAERAGLNTGDVLVSLRGESLAASEQHKQRDIIYEVMSDIEDGEEISVSVLRDGEQGGPRSGGRSSARSLTPGRSAGEGCAGRATAARPRRARRRPP